MTFVHLPENCKYINLDAVKHFNPNRSNRLDYLDGTHEQLSEGDAAVLMNAMSWLASPQVVQQAEPSDHPKPRRRGRPKKATPKT